MGDSTPSWCATSTAPATPPRPPTRRSARGERRPLLGVPMTIKESFNVAGLPTTWGIPAAKDFAPTEDALAVARLKAAGAVILGKTNVPLMLADWQSYNDIYGTTNNPWDLARTPGGSSGGSAAALAAGFVPLSSAPTSAARCARRRTSAASSATSPRYGSVPPRGHAPPGARPCRATVDLAVVGPMARSAADLALALDILAGPDEQRDGVAYRLALPPPRHDALKDFRVLVIDEHPLLPTAERRCARRWTTRRSGSARPASRSARREPAPSRPRRGGAALHAAVAAGLRRDLAARALRRVKDHRRGSRRGRQEPDRRAQRAARC